MFDLRRKGRDELSKGDSPGRWKLLAIILVDLGFWPIDMHTSDFHPVNPVLLIPSDNKKVQKVKSPPRFPSPPHLDEFDLR